MTNLSLNDVFVSRGDFSVTVSFDVAAGSVIALTGANGSGKSTVVEAIAGLLPPRAGRIVVDDVVFDDTETHLNPEDRFVGYVPQRHVLFGHLSALDNVAYGLRARGMNKHEATERALPWLSRFGLSDHAHKKADRLSGGQSQRVAIARALCAQPRVLLLDEPFSSLDAAIRPHVIETVRESINELNVPTVFVSHDPAEVNEFADHTIIFSR